jgi:signal peptidase I
VSVIVAALALVACLGTAVAVVVLRRRLVLVEVDGISMRPTYEPGDRVLVRRCRADRVRPGQVVVLEPPDEKTGWSSLPPLDGRLSGRRWYIKRVAAVPGDLVPGAVSHVVGQPGGRVPAGRLVVLGESARSDDSRWWGYVPGERVLGVVVRELGSLRGR